MILRKTAQSLLGIFLLTFTACAYFQKNYFQEPKANLKEVLVRDVGLQGATLIFVLEIQNPNKSELKIGEVSYQTFLNNEFFSEAKVEKTQVIPAEQTSTVELPLPVLYSKMAGGIARVLKGEQVEYRIKGDAKIALFKLPFDKTGKLELGKK